MHTGTPPQPQPDLPELAQVKRYWDRQHQTFAAKILPGGCYVTTEDEAIVTVLGSCICACVRDPVAGIGGMNHFMLPQGKNAAPSTARSAAANNGAAARYGNFAMEQLINLILSHGGERRRLEVKLFGGGRVLQALTDIGARNIAFVRDYVATERLSVLAQDLGGDLPRKVYYFPASGRARVKRLTGLRNRRLLAREASYRERIAKAPVAGDVELFQREVEDGR